MVHLAPLSSVVGGLVGLVIVASSDGLSPAGWIAGCLYLIVSNLLLTRGLLRGGAARFGPANAATSIRSTLVGVITALVATSFTTQISVPLLIGLTAPALALDAVDGWLARRTHTASELGARFDMEVDAFLILVLSAFVAQDLGWWVLMLGLMRYAYVVAGWLLPWLRGAVPPRYWGKVVAAVTGISLASAASGLAPTWFDAVVVLGCLVLLIESFGRDVVWLYVRHRATVPRRIRPSARGMTAPIIDGRGEGVAHL
ncbi:CDP-alcohol phosphatidyltransferase family protein [Microbacterium deminutum]